MCNAIVSVIIAAAGSSTRMGEGISKQMISISGKPVIEYSIDTFSKSSLVKSIIVSAKPDEVELLSYLKEKYPKVSCIVEGGKERSESVLKALERVSEATTHVAIHDAARPLIRLEDVEEIISLAIKYGAVCPVSKAVDTVKISSDGVIEKTIDRNTVFLASTPQVFEISLYKNAINNVDKNARFTDDSSMVEFLGEKVHLYVMKSKNTKITTVEDLEDVRYHVKEKSKVRIGHGYDVHRLTGGRKLIIGGVEIEHETGLLGHSDADVLVHAIMDAILGALALRDIGYHFPDSDEKFKGASSIELLKKVKDLLQNEGYSISNIDATVIAQKPKLASYIDKMRENIANALDIETYQVNIKATTEEKLGFTGEELGISAHAVTVIS